MGKKAAGTVLAIDRTFSGKAPLHRQLYLGMKRAILEGRLHPGERLPSTRVMADDLGFSRTTVLNAFDQLAAEGYLEGRVGSGTRVASYIPGHLGRLDTGRQRASRVSAKVSRRAQTHSFADLSFLRSPARPLRPGEPEAKLFPRELWARLAAKHWRLANRDPEHIDSLGYRPLRQAICDYVRRLRGVRCEPERVLIVCGAQQALYLAANVLLDPGEPVWMEDPGYPRARAAFAAAGLRIISVPVDSQGLIVTTGKSKEPSPKLVYVTPSFQCPLGCMMSLARRFELLQFASERDAWILEDDYFSEYRYGSSPVASLQSIDQSERVIYIGNFSKNVAPSLRIGYLILPAALVQVFKSVRSAISRQPPAVEQAILAQFISSGRLEMQVRATLRLYRERQQALLTAIQEYGKGILQATDTGTGMYLVAWLPPGVDDRAAAQTGAEHGVDTVPISAFCIKPLRRQGLVLGYSSYEPNQIRNALKKLCAALS